MNEPGNPSPPTSKRESPLQGPRPSPLRVSKDSHKIGKPPIAPRPPQLHPSQFQPGVSQPVVIYTVSPKPIQVEASNFMSLVQRLTGRESSETEMTAEPSFPYSGDAPISPAARLASIERASPTERDRRRGDFGDEFLLGMLAEEHEGAMVSGVDVSQMPGILSPAPANLPTISPGLFLPAPADGQNLFGSDWLMSPFMSNSNSFLPSPSALFFNATAIVSPTLSPGSDLFNIFDF